MSGSNVDPEPWAGDGCAARGPRGNARDSVTSRLSRLRPAGTKVVPRSAALPFEAERRPCFWRERHGRDPQRLRTETGRGEVVRGVGGPWLVPRRPRSGPAPLLHHDAAAERHRGTAYWPCPQQCTPRLPDPLEPDARPQRHVAAGPGPRQHRGARGHGAPAGGARPHAFRPRPGALPRGNLEVEGADRRDDPPPAAAAGMLI